MYITAMVVVRPAVTVVARVKDDGVTTGGDTAAIAAAATRTTARATAARTGNAAAEAVPLISVLFSFFCQAQDMVTRFIFLLDT